MGKDKKNFSPGLTDTSNMSDAKSLAVVLVDEGYEDLEVHYPRLRLEEAGFHVEVAGDKSGHNYKSKHGYWAKSTKLFSEIDATQVKVLIVPGGWAPDRLRRWQDCLNLVHDANAAGAVVGAYLPASFPSVTAHFIVTNLFRQ